FPLLWHLAGRAGADGDSNDGNQMTKRAGIVLGRVGVPPAVLRASRSTFIPCHSERSEEPLIISGLPRQRLPSSASRNGKRCFASLNMTAVTKCVPQDAERGGRDAHPTRG